MRREQWNFRNAPFSYCLSVRNAYVKMECHFPMICNHKFRNTFVTKSPSASTDVVGSTLPCASISPWSCLFSLSGKALYLILSTLLSLGNLQLSLSDVNDPVRFDTRYTLNTKSTNSWTFYIFLFICWVCQPMAILIPVCSPAYICAPYR